MTNEINETLENDTINYTLEILTHKTVPFKYPVAESERKQIPSKFILCGEDDKDDEDLVKEIFSSVDESFSLHFVNNGRKLVATLEQLPDDGLPCLLVLDYNMPELNGAEILKELKKINRYDSIPKIIWSTSGAEMYKQLCLNLGAADYVIKPSNVNDLQQIVRYMISHC
jgi:CheY-like chemotaxis protein